MRTSTEVELARTVLTNRGMSQDDMGTALEAVFRCRGYTAWSVGKCAQFVAAAAAIGQISGPQLLLIADLARIAAFD